MSGLTQKRLHCYKTRIIFVALLLTVLFVLDGLFAVDKEAFLSGAELTDPANYAKNEVIVQFSADCTEERVSEICNTLGLEIKTKTPKRPIYLLKIISSATERKIIDDLRKYHEVVNAELNYELKSNKVPNDTRFSNPYNYGPQKINLEEAWDIITDASSIVVAVIDNGVDYYHPDLTNNMWVNSGDPIDWIDNDNNGYVDDNFGWNFASDYSDPLPYTSSLNHGTLCAGIIGAEGNNGFGSAGVCWKVKIMPLVIANSDSLDAGSFTINLVNAIYYAVDNGAKVISCSWGICYGSTGLPSSFIRDAIDYANAEGVLFIASAGNASSTTDVRNNDVISTTSPIYPASFNCDNIISVAATNASDSLTEYSYYGLSSVDIAAPGHVLSTTYASNLNDPDNAANYTMSTGTSFACPYVAGACALVWAHFPNLSHLEVKDKVLQGADCLSSLGGLVAGGRRLNVYGALTHGTTPAEGTGYSHSTEIVSTNGVPVIAERSMYWDTGGVSWRAGHTSSGVTSPATTWYLAEGCTNDSEGFEEYITIQNPSSSSSAEVDVSFVVEGTNTETKYVDVTIPPSTRHTLRVNDITELKNKSLSAKVASTNGVDLVVERSMYWDSGGVNWAGGTNSAGISTPSTTWYFAEGCTGSGVTTYILIQNPNGSSADVTLTFMDNAGNRIEKQFEGDTAISKYTRKTINIADYMNNVYQVSTKIESSVPIVAERSMYWSAGSFTKAEGHCASGATSPSSLWYLAEGCTKSFKDWVLIQNPNSTTATVTLTFMKSDGTNVPLSVTVGPWRRKNIYVNDYVSDFSFSTKVESSLNTVVERAMYWGESGGHCSMGIISPSTAWYFAEGCTDGIFTEWLLIQNPNNSSSEVSITYMRSDGVTIVQNATVPALRRYTICANDVSGL